MSTVTESIREHALRAFYLDARRIDLVTDAGFDDFKGLSLSALARRARKTLQLGGFELESPEPAAWCVTQMGRLATMPYDLYLTTTEWQDVRYVARRWARERCQVCNQGGWLDVHHRTYENRGDEYLADLIVLCRECHQTFHRGRTTR